MKLNHVTNPYPMDDELRADIMREIPEKISVRKRPVRSGLGLGRPAWAFFAAGRAGLWATVRLSGPI